jgi:RNA polymerase sigma-70 factor (ECF subfamily)
MRLSCHDFKSGGALENVARSMPIISRDKEKVERSTTDPDGDLVRRVSGGDLDAFASLVERHQRSVYSIVSRMLRERDEVDDVVQDVFVLAFRSLAKFRGDAMFATWLHSIAVNTTLKHLKKSKRRSAASLDDPEAGIADHISAPTPDPVDEVTHNANRDIVRREVAQLPDKQKAVVVLYYFEEYSCEEIARVLGCSVGTVWSRLHYACRKLRGRLEWLDETTED